MAGIDPRLFGGSELPEEFRDEFPAQVPPAQEVQEAAVPAGSLLSTSAAAREGAALRSEANREKAGFLASLGAGIVSTDTASVLAWATAPEFPMQEGYTNAENFKQVPFVMSEDQFKFLSEAKSQAEWDWRQRRVQTLNEAGAVAADNPLAGFLPHLIDPVYIGADILSAGAAKAFRVGRAGAGALGAASAAGISLAAGEAAPITMEETLFGALINGAASSMVYRGGKLVVRDPDFPADELNAAAKPKVKLVGPGQFEPVVPAKPKVTLAEAQASRAPVIEPEEAEALVDTSMRTWSQKFGEALQPAWLTMRKQMDEFGEVGKRVSRTLYDNNSDLSATSVEANRRAIRSELTTMQRVFEDTLKKALADEGIGLKERIFSPRKAAQRQEEVLREVQLEMFRREQLTRQGRQVTFENVPRRVKEMADHLDATAERALKELQAAGVDGAEEIVARAGWHHRQWSVSRIERVTEKFKAAGMDADKAHKATVRLVGTALRRANGWDNQLAYDVGAAIVNRTLRKGYFEDAAFNMHQGAGAIKQLRDILVEEGLSGPRLQRALDVLAGKNAEAGKPGFLKRRMDLDYTAATVVDGEVIRVTDLIDPNLVTVTERYLDGVASQAAWARAGFKNANDIDKLRSELLHSIPDTDTRRRAEKLFDNTSAFLRGDAAGEEMHQGMRTLSMYGRMIALANSGLWQFTEYATIMSRYGLVKTTKYAIQEMPVFRKLWDDAASDPLTSSRLKDVLTRQSEQDLRLRPYLHRYEDNFEMPVHSSVQLALQQSEQLVPYLNGMKYIHHHQARLSANLIVDRLAQAAKGDEIARKALQKYGIELRVMDKLADEVKLHGTDTAKWSDEVWGSVRPAFAKMMDEAVLHARLGDMPAFAMFDKVGKFIFTYRSFMLTAHNKVLAGTIGREGATGMGLLLMYQFPLAMLAVQAQSGLQGKGALSMEDAAHKAIGQMGGMGLFSEAWGVVSGDRKQFGAPGLIPIDRLYSAAGDAAQGNFSQAGHGALQMVPLLGILQPIRALENLTKE